MMKLIISVLAVSITSYLLPGVKLAGWMPALVVAVTLGVVNLIIKPVLLIFTLPFNILTFGLFTFIINGALVLLVSKLVPGFSVDGLLTAVLFSIIISVVSWFLEGLT